MKNIRLLVLGILCSWGSAPLSAQDFYPGRHENASLEDYNYLRYHIEYQRVKGKYEEASREAQRCDRETQGYERQSQAETQLAQQRNNEALILANRLTQLHANLQQLLAQSPVNQPAVDALRMQIASVDQEKRAKEQEAAQATGRAQVYSTQATNSRECAERLWARARLLERARDDYYREYRRRHEYYQDGLQYAARVGQDDGREDGRREGQETGETDGRREGERRGQDDGIREGTAAGQQREYQVGFASGRVTGTPVGRDVGQREGTATGTQKGKEEGFAAGLQQGFKKGYDAGYAAQYPVGRERGLNSGAFGEGRIKGLAEGQTAALRDARAKDYPRGVAKADDEAHVRPLRPVTVPNKPSVGGSLPGASWEGVRGNAWGGNGEQDLSWAYSGRYYAPRRNFAHPDLQREYRDHYDRGFEEGRRNAYQPSYDAASRSAYQDRYQTYYRRYESQSYPEDRGRGEREGYERGYQEGYQAAYKIAYQAAYDQYFEIERQRALPIRYEEGKKAGESAGLAQGEADGRAEAFENGRKEGYQAAYAEYYPRFAQEQFTAGYGDRLRFYRTNAVPEIQQVSLADLNGDGVFEPGEAFTITARLKNFGDVNLAAGELRAVVAGDAAVKVYIASENLVAVDAATDTTVTLIGHCGTSPDLPAASRGEVKVRLLWNDRLLGEQTLGLIVGYPLTVMSHNFTDSYVRGVPADLTFAIRNLSNKTTAGAVTLAIRPSSPINAEMRVTPAVLDLGSLASGEERSGSLRVELSPKAALTELPLELVVSDAGRTVTKFPLSGAVYTQNNGAFLHKGNFDRKGDWKPLEKVLGNNDTFSLAIPRGTARHGMTKVSFNIRQAGMGSGAQARVYLQIKSGGRWTEYGVESYFGGIEERLAWKIKPEDRLAVEARLQFDWISDRRSLEVRNYQADYE